MKLQKTIMVFLTAALLAITPLSAMAGKGGKGGKVKPPVVELSAWEEDLLFMREEEKLARDVYVVMYDLWDAPIFFNISEAEQSHMDALKKLVVKYGLTDPVTDDTTGVFDNAELGAMYVELVDGGEDQEYNFDFDGVDNVVGDAGSESSEAALLVGALIEEVDILDLEEAMAIEGTPTDVIQTYENLLEGSYNHLRAFVGQLGEYDARVLTQDEVDDILLGGSANLKGSAKPRRGR